MTEIDYDYELAMDPIADLLYEVYEVKSGKVVAWARTPDEALAAIDKLKKGLKP